MSLHTCQACGRERHAAALELIDTPRGALITCRDADEGGRCVAPEAWRVVFRVEGWTGDGFAGRELAATEADACRMARELIGRRVRAAYEEARAITWTRAEALQRGEWVPLLTAEAVTA